MKNKIWSERFITLLFAALCMCFIGVLFYFSMVVTGYTITDYTVEYPYLSKDSWGFNILYIALVIIIVTVVVKINTSLKLKVNLDIVAVIICAVAFLVSIFFTEQLMSVPVADQKLLCEYASAFNKGDYTGLQKGGYIAIYTQQLGIVTLLRILFALFGDGNYKAFQWFCIILVPVLVYSGYSITKHIKGETNSDLIYLIIVALCFPMYVYVSFVYGDLPSTALVMCGCAVILSDMQRHSLPKSIAAGILIAAALLLRKNVLVFFIAIMIVLIMKLIFGKRNEIFVLSLSIIGIVILSQLGIKLMYAGHIPADSHPSPAILHIAMGTNEDNIMPGAFNGYVYDTYSSCNFDTEEAKKAGYRTLEAFWQKCMDDKAYFGSFCYRKFNQQWCTPFYQSTVMVRNSEATSRFVQMLYEPEVHKGIEDIYNVYQSLIYFGVLLCLLYGIKKWSNIENYILLIAVFGGGLFSMIWEAKPRYVFPFFLVMLPYAAVGLGQLSYYVINVICSKKEK